MLKLALRMQRGGVLGCLAIGAIFALVNAAGFGQVAGATQAERLRFGAQMEIIGRQISYILPLPVRADTLGGYLQWRVFGTLPLIFGFWGNVSAAGAIRGEEERGLLEQWLGAGISRGRLITVRVCAYALGSAVAIGATCAACWLGSMAAGTSLPIAALLGTGAALLSLSLCCYAVGLLAAQLSVTARGAAGLGGSVLLGLFLLNSLGRTSAAVGPYRWFSPFYFVERSNALVPGGAVDGSGIALLLGLTPILSAVSAVAFMRRDLGSSLLQRRTADHPPVLLPSANLLFRWPVLPGLFEQRLGLTCWVAGTMAIGLFLVSLTGSVADALRELPAFQPYLRSLGGGEIHQMLIGQFWFSTGPLLLAIYAILQVGRWSAEDGSGRLEMMLSQPVRRRRIVLERAVSLCITCALIIAAGSATVELGAGARAISLHTSGVLRASLVQIPLGLVFGAIGAAITGRLPRATVPLLTGFAVASYFIQQLGVLFRWPAWLLNLSVFQLYGTPLTNGVSWGGFWALTAITTAGFAVALIVMERRDVGR